MAFNVVWVCLFMSFFLMPSVQSSPDCKKNPSAEVKIAYSYVSEFNLIWNDKESRADKDVSIWQPVPQEDDFYPLGDFAHNSHNKSEKPSLMVKAIKKDALAAPKGMTYMWSDVCSRAKRNVQIYKLDPKEGYTCLGHVALGSYVGKPDMKKYRCVKTEYVKRGKYLQIWKDKGSEGSENIGLWARTSLGIDKGIDANVFTSMKNYDFPEEGPHILNSDYAKHVSFVSAYTAKVPALIAYEQTDVEQIWSDKGSGAYKNFSVWRPKGVQNYYNLGDYAVSSFSKPKEKMLIFRPSEENVLRSPSYYRKVWDDAGSGADEDVSFWKPICPEWHVLTGHMAVKSHHKGPARDDMKCLRCDYIDEKNTEWKRIWDDKGSRAYKDVTVCGMSGAKPNTMKAEQPNCSSDPGYGIKESEIHNIKSKPAKKFIVSNVKYNTTEKTVFRQERYQVQQITLDNHENTAKTIAQTIGYFYMERRRWDHDSDLESSLPTEVVAGIPTVSDGRVTFSAEGRHKAKSRSSGYYTKPGERKVSAEVQPKSKRSVTVVATLYKIKVSYTCSVETTYMDEGKESQHDVKGVYYGLYFDSFKSVYDPDVPL